MVAWASPITEYSNFPAIVSGALTSTYRQLDTTVARCIRQPFMSSVSPHVTSRGAVIVAEATGRSTLIPDAEVAPAIVIKWQSSDLAFTLGTSHITYSTPLTALVTSMTLSSTSASGSAMNNNPETSTPTAHSSHSRLSSGETAGIAIGCTFAGLLLIGVAFLFWRRRSSRQSKIDHPEPLEGSSAPKPSLEEVATVPAFFQNANRLTELPAQCPPQELEARGSTAELDGSGQRTEVVTRPENGCAKHGRPDGPSGP